MVSVGAFKTTFLVLSFYMPAEAPQSINSPEDLYRCIIHGGAWHPNRLREQ